MALVTSTVLSPSMKDLLTVRQQGSILLDYDLKLKKDVFQKLQPFDHVRHDVFWQILR